MFDTSLEIAVTAGSALIVYHHALYPRLAAMLGDRVPAGQPAPARRELPRVTVVMPAFNEARFIAAKIDSLAEQDYPSDRLEILIGCDGCTDATAALARAAAARHPQLRIIISDHARNRGKVAVLNDLMRQARGGITVLTDVSALLPADAVRRLVERFDSPAVGAVGAGYCPAEDTTDGEKAYWAYQGRIKRGESRLGGLIGAHGSCYAIRTGLYRSLAPDTVNDDFLIPMQIALRGWRTVYAPEIRVRELEATANRADFRRRIRIGRGNAQQLAAVLPQLLRCRPGLALAFLSGKGARVLMPFLMLLVLAGSVVGAAMGSVPMLALACGQAVAYLAAALPMLRPGLQRVGKLEALRYLVAGHVASAVGVTQFITGRRHGTWQRVAQA